MEIKLLTTIKTWLQEGLRQLRHGGVRRGKKGQESSFGDALLSDALRLAEIPSPTEQEEDRAAFVLERLRALDLAPLVNESGSVLCRLQAEDLEDGQPLLLFADLGSTRWHPLDSLARLDTEYARGAGLADSLGAAALLSLAEGVRSGRLKPERDLLLFFGAHSPGSPEVDLFAPVLRDSGFRPFAALALRGLPLDLLINPFRGFYRLEVHLQSRQSPGDPSTEDSPAVVNTLASLARMLLGISWDSEGITQLYIRRMEAQSALFKTPQEGLLELELESMDAQVLEMAMGTVKSTIERVIAEAQSLLLADTQVSSFIPVGGEGVNRGITGLITALMRDQKIRYREERGVDICAFLSNQGVPALTLGLAQGREERGRDTIEINSVNRGRLLLEQAVLKLCSWANSGAAL